MPAKADAARYLFLVPVWGRKYLELFLDVCLPLMLTKGNLGHFGGRSDAVFLILTTRADCKLLEAHESFLRLRSMVRTEILLIDGLVDFSSPHKAMSDAYVLGMNSRFVQRSSTYYVFLTPDSFWSDGSFRRLEDLAGQRYNAVMVVGLRTSLQHMEPYLSARIGMAPDDPAIPNRELVTQSLRALHPMAKAHDWLSGRFINAWPSQVYWRLGRDLMFVRAFHMHPLMVLAPKKRVKVGTTIDGDFLTRLGYEASRYHVVTDSDEMVGIEMTDHNRDWGQELTPASIDSLVDFATYQLDDIHRSFFEHQIVFRGQREIPVPSEVQENMETVLRTYRRRSHARRAMTFGPLRWLSFRVWRARAIARRLAARLRQVLR